MFFSSDNTHFKKPVIGMNMVSTEELSGRDVIACIKIVKNNKTRSKFQSEKTE